MVQTVTSKLSNWKVKVLLVNETLTLIKSVLGAINTFFMSIYKAPKGILFELEALWNKYVVG